jgi:hypothetical protein
LIYWSNAIHPRHQANFWIFAPLDFLAEVSAHIPDPHEKTTLFYGWYSNRSRGYRKQRRLRGEANTEPPPSEADEQAPLKVRRSWARLIRKVYEVDPLLCPRCGGTMRVIAVIEQPAVVRQILDHLGIAVRSNAERSPPGAARGLAVSEAPEWSYEPVEDYLPLPDPLTI